MRGEFLESVVFKKNSVLFDAFAEELGYYYAATKQL